MSAFSSSKRLFFASLFVRHVLGISVTVPVAAPSTAPKVSQSLVSFSIEQDRWTDWVGTTSQNQFFFNTLDNLKQLTGEPPHIRIGADSEDRTNFNPNVQFAQDVFPAPSTVTPYPEASTVVVGDGFYQAVQFLPPNTHVIWGVNFGKNNLTAAFLEAKAIVKAFASSAVKAAGITLDSIEIGNEADLYSSNGDRASGYSVAQYVPQWVSFATNVSAAAGISKTSTTKFWGAAFAGSSHSTTGFSPQGIFANNILSSAPGSLITAISQHHYSGSFCAGNGGILQDLMTKSTIRGNLTQYSPDIAAVQAEGFEYFFGETNSYSCHGAPGVSNTAGAALWTLDYVLFASQIGISRVFFHEGIGYKYNLIQPVTLTKSTTDGSTLTTPLPPHIQPQYYGAIIAAEAIGNSGSTTAVELTINNTIVSGYAFYVGDKLARAVLINSQAFLSTTTTARNSVHIDLSLTGSGAPKTMTIKRLAIGHADDTSGLTWGGQSFETSTARPSGAVEVTTANVSSGVDIQETEVVLLSFL
ncbi:glycoside hydrolase family 79 protein [Gymnopilus junonius]|uniref:Glycoside hydrolase family 79 protein n=1 Tax=Gymnopilus junonius TaxID=109634 RepID=A0A9P5NMG3_GYMJU|nr:glycoside hydrolase family 79 protein [Gymnopilus junonius]